MARARQFDREAALDLAMNEFWRKGYCAVSVKPLCEQMGITRSSFYHSFGSLDALFEEVMSLYLSYNPMLELDDQNLTAAQAIRRCFKVLCKLRAKDKQHRGCLIINNLNESYAMPPKTAKSLQAKIDNSISALEASVERAKSEGLISPTQNSRALALCLQSLATGINTLSMQVHNEKELWEIADTTLSGLGV
ncbi:TetR/AcrR family transcriptional regulator [uncultured Pseudoteredinibacter sp.]|uniref:TetR/AcrR family transcriptional regulator n=1 Tax=uncultured Pseudoteredinibacter sp. TaxID=1641701 RepID=UPI00263107C8|nr:TetR/AcrR family transcriptional regulator [uncultured Pseudoteredinibacter sp.]